MADTSTASLEGSHVKMTSDSGKRKRYDPHRYERRILRAKVKCRPELDINDWHRWGYRYNNYWPAKDSDRVPRIDCALVSKLDFVSLYEQPRKPVVILGCTRHWSAETNWTPERLLEDYAESPFKIGEDDEGDPVRVKFKYFMRYLNSEAGQIDDSPLYIFESSFREPSTKYHKTTEIESTSTSTSITRPTKRSLLGDYTSPSYFSEDLFKLTGSRRPPYRWFVMGGARSGTGIHIDPLGTSAWNTLLVGHKRWAMFPPGTPESVYDPPMKPYDHEGVAWFTHVYPRLIKPSEEYGGKSAAEYYGMVEMLQHPKETVFVPGGWAHVVMNLDLTIAITQNFCSSTNVEYVYLRARHSRPRMAQRFVRELNRMAMHGTDGTSIWYAGLRLRIARLQTIPRLPPSSDDSSDNDSSSNSSSCYSDQQQSDNDSRHSSGSASATAGGLWGSGSSVDSRSSSPSSSPSKRMRYNNIVSSSSSIAATNSITAIVDNSNYQQQQQQQQQNSSSIYPHMITLPNGVQQRIGCRCYRCRVKPTPP
ncbi:hypothetical protein BDF22DRAFT_746652 [Syncephalis plumigaleata]|nr:hypothetical protein BDF22DRAFT_746652 [Syncephalis plumigaleata]